MLGVVGAFFDRYFIPAVESGDLKAIKVCRLARLFCWKLYQIRLFAAVVADWLQLSILSN
jgi:hypothetical protein